MFGALVNGKRLYSEWFERLNAHSFVDFMNRFVTTLNKRKKYVFVLDNGPCHKAKMTQRFFSIAGRELCHRIFTALFTPT